MGNSIETMYSTKDENGHQYYAVFENSYFSEGVSRYAFKGTLRGGGPRSGDPCVVKVFKKAYAKSFDEWVPDLAASMVSKSWTTKFNQQAIPSLNLTETRAIDFVVPIIARVDDKTMEGCFGKKNNLIKPQEYLSIEEFIPGNYQKFNSNGGYEDQELSAILPAFSHWVWEQSGRTIMICDLQGVKQTIYGGVRYKLTDPAINSVDQIYGMTDLGVAGMERVLASHHCNFICRLLNLVNPIPGYARHQFSAVKASTYNFQLSAEEKRKNQRRRGEYFQPMSTIQE